ncbi:MAG: Fic family protein [Dehalococcoidia bacterium]|nr:Fic family protein [Dehalococcoidia bacterium]
MNVTQASHYRIPERWMRYDPLAVAGALVEARTAAGVLNRLPYLPAWIEQVHKEQLRLEAVGTTRIEGADFTPDEERQALAPGADTGELTHSQRQLRSANAAYEWIRSRPPGQPVSIGVILAIHRLIVTGCDDDHCEPGALRRDGANVTFGAPVCRGAEGGEECQAVFDDLLRAVATKFKAHDRIVQAMAVHYHLGAMHPFDDGNGRAARAAEALMLRTAGVNDQVMVSLSNYYYEHQSEYLAALYESRERGHDLTPFLLFALRALADRCNAVADQITAHTKRALFREFAQSLFSKLSSPRRRVLAERQLHILTALLDKGEMSLQALYSQIRAHYTGLKHPNRAAVRDLMHLLNFSAVDFRREQGTLYLAINLDWPQRFSETELMKRIEELPTSASAAAPALPDLARLLGRDGERRA